MSITKMYRLVYVNTETLQVTVARESTEPLVIPTGTTKRQYLLFQQQGNNWCKVRPDVPVNYIVTHFGPASQLLGTGSYGEIYQVGQTAVKILIDTTGIEYSELFWIKQTADIPYVVKLLNHNISVAHEDDLGRLLNPPTAPGPYYKLELQMEIYDDNLTGFGLVRPMADRELACLKMASIINQLHARGIVHGDIKPSNFTIKYTDASFDIFLIDLGMMTYTGCINHKFMAKIETSEKLYTQGYAVKGEKIGVRTDIFALAITLYEILTNDCGSTSSLSLASSDSIITEHNTRMRRNLTKVGVTNQRLIEFIVRSVVPYDERTVTTDHLLDTPVPLCSLSPQQHNSHISTPQIPSTDSSSQSLTLSSIDRSTHAPLTHDKIKWYRKFYSSVITTKGPLHVPMFLDFAINNITLLSNSIPTTKIDQLIEFLNSLLLLVFSGMYYKYNFRKSYRTIVNAIIQCKRPYNPSSDLYYYRRNVPAFSMLSSYYHPLVVNELFTRRNLLTEINEHFNTKRTNTTSLKMESAYWIDDVDRTLVVTYEADSVFWIGVVTALIYDGLPLKEAAATAMLHLHFPNPTFRTKLLQRCMTTDGPVTVELSDRTIKLPLTGTLQATINQFYQGLELGFLLAPRSRRINTVTYNGIKYTVSI